MVGASLENEKGNLTYATGIGANGAEPRPLKAMNQKARRMLQSAASKMDPKVQICMKGKHHKGVYQVISVKLRNL